jgi:hypothetical protein
MTGAAAIFSTIAASAARPPFRDGGLFFATAKDD